MASATFFVSLSLIIKVIFNKDFMIYLKPIKQALFGG